MILPLTLKRDEVSRKDTLLHVSHHEHNNDMDGNEYHEGVAEWTVDDVPQMENLLRSRQE